jgi:hypothetical protein
VIIFNQFVFPVYKKLTVFLDEVDVLETLMDLKYNQQKRVAVCSNNASRLKFLMHIIEE